MASPTLSVQPFASPNQARDRSVSLIWWFGSLGFLFAALYLAAFALQRYGDNTPALIAVGSALLTPGWHNVAECVAAATSVGSGFLFPTLMLRLWRWAER